MPRLIERGAPSDLAERLAALVARRGKIWPKPMSSRGRHISAPAARTTARPSCRKTAWSSPELAVTPWRGHGPQHSDDDAHGRRGRELDRHLALHRSQACFSERRRWHLFPLRPTLRPRHGGGRCLDHVQDSLQRCGRDDRGPAARRHLDGPATGPAARSGRRQADRARCGRPGQVSIGRRHSETGDDPSSRRARSACSASLRISAASRR